MSRRQRLVGLVPLLAAAGVMVTGYLSRQAFSEAAPWCPGGGSGCAAVALSPYARLGGLPVAVFGLGAYVILLVLGMVWAHHGPRAPLWAPLGVLGLSLSGTLISLYFTWVSLAVLQAACTWCLTSAGLFTATLLLTAWLLRQGA